MRQLFVVIFTLFFVSCGTKNVISGKKASKNVAAKEVIANHYNKALDFSTIRGRMKIDFNDGHTQQNFTVSFRMQKDSAIWLSATLSVVKVLITPNRVSFYNKLDNTYFDGDFSYLSKLLGTELNFYKVQNLLLGQAIQELNPSDFKVTASGNAYKLEPKEEDAFWQQLFVVDPAHYKMVAQQVSMPLQNRSLQIFYNNYLKIDNKTFPDKIILIATEGVAQTKIELEYKNITFNERVTFPYRIPEGFNEIVLE